MKNIRLHRLSDYAEMGKALVCPGEIDFVQERHRGAICFYIQNWRLFHPALIDDYWVDIKVHRYFPDALKDIALFNKSCGDLSADQSLGAVVLMSAYDTMIRK